MKKNIPDQHIDRPYLKDLRELIDYGAEHYTQRPAFQYREDKEIVDVSAAQVKEDVVAFAEYLLKNGYRNGSKIAIFSENSYMWIITYLAAVNSGNVIVPIDKELKPSEVATILNGCSADMLIYSKAKEKQIEEIKAAGISTDKFMCINTDYEAALAEGRETAKNDGEYYNIVLDREKMCAIIYTSGTTGDPKGVMLSHKNLASDAYNSMSCMIIEECTTSILPMNHTFGFMASVLCQLWMGHTVFINTSLRMVLKDIQASKPWYISVVPLFLENFYKNIWKAIDKQGKTKAVKALIKFSNALRKVGIDKRRVFFKSIIDNFGGNLHMIITGGAPISDKYMKGFDDLGIMIINGYGITECSPIVALNRNNNIRFGTVGNPIPNVQIKIENPDADGEGEIWVKGDIVMLGYYNKPEETAKVLKDGWFNTGDIGRYEDNFLTITGREKNVIILDNGKNVYPEEIETLISYIPNVTEAVVYQADNTIVAEVYSDAEGDKNEIMEQIKAEIAEVNKKLASYKQVKRIKFRDTEFEKTATKKIKRALIEK